MLKFWNHYGPERIRDYIHTTVKTGGEYIQLSLGEVCLQCCYEGRCVYSAVIRGGVSTVLSLGEVCLQCCYKGRCVYSAVMRGGVSTVLL